MRAAAVQLNSDGDRPRNLEIAESLVREAAGAGAELVALPEKWNLFGSGEDMAAGAEPLDGESLTAARSWARELGIHLLAGSIAEMREGERPSNTSVLIDPAGEDLAVYRKIHMFDVDVGGVEYRESATEAPGDEIVLSDAADGTRLGLSICYDLRFPELYRILAVRGAEVLCVPAAFTVPTTRDHWEVLLRARAIENQLFVIAPNQSGEAPPEHSSYGRSMIVDPWGLVLAQAPDVEGVVTADLDADRLREVRRRMPILDSRRPEAYAWPQEAEVG